MQLVRVLLAFLLAVSAGAVHAQYPSRPINLVVPFIAGSDADLAARNLAHAPRYLNAQTIGVLNQPGDPGWLGGIPAVRSPAETEAFVRAQYELYEKLAERLGLRN